MTSETPSRPDRRARRLLPALLAVGLVCLLAAFLLPVPGGTPTAPTNADDPADAPLVPTFALTERSGKKVTDADLRGKVWVASFVFTRCTGPCPSVSGTMARLQAEMDLPNRDAVRLVTFTIDPERDDPAELGKYADKYRADKERWLFLTGPEATMHSLAQDGFKMTAKRAATPKPGEEFDHSTRLAVVDKQGRLRGYFDGFQGKHDTTGEHYTAGLERLKELVYRLERE